MMTVASALTAMNTDIVNARTAITTKGGTVTSGGGSSQLATDIATIPTGGTPTGKYQLLDRVKNDSNVAIGTVAGFFTDANDVEYAVVCLDAQYRLASGAWISNTSAVVTNLPAYADQTLWSAKETATFNTQKILDYCSSKGYTSTSCTHCRSKSFTIGGTTYYGQLPNAIELVDIFTKRVEINNIDTTVSSYSSLKIPTASRTWSSSQCNAGNSWFMAQTGVFNATTKISNYLVVPVLEIPNEV